MGKSVQRPMGGTKVREEQRECWGKSAKLDTEMMDVLQVNKIVFCGGIFILDSNHFHDPWIKIIYKLSIFHKLASHFPEPGPESVVNSKSNTTTCP